MIQKQQIQERKSVLLEQAKNSQNDVNHQDVKGLDRTRLIDFSLIYISKPKQCLNGFLKRLNDEIQNYELDAGRLNKRSRVAEEELKHCIKSLALNLWHNHYLSHDKPVYLSISLNKNNYGKNKEFEFARVSYKQFNCVYKGMLALGYLEVRARGYYDENNPEGNKRTSVYATEKFLKAFQEKIGAKAFIIKKDKKRALYANPILKRDREKKRVRYSDTAEIKRYRSNVKRINTLLLSTEISLDFQKIDARDLEQEIEQNYHYDREYKRPYIDLTQTVLRRIFSNNSFEQGGRFYGGWWQNIPKKFRPFIALNGENTVELDYSELHPHMLYDDEGVPMPKDPYRINDLVSRKVGKIAFNALLNAKKDPKSEPNQFWWLEYEHGLTWEKYLVEMKEYHAPVAHRFATGYGMTLQFMDSQMAEMVMLHFTNKGIPCLSIHDSFIVSSKHRAELESVMLDAYKTIMSTDRDIPIKS